MLRIYRRSGRARWGFLIGLAEILDGLVAVMSLGFLCADWATALRLICMSQGLMVGLREPRARRSKPIPSEKCPGCGAGRRDDGIYECESVDLPGMRESRNCLARQRDQWKERYRNLNAAVMEGDYIEDVDCVLDCANDGADALNKLGDIQEIEKRAEKAEAENAKLKARIHRLRVRNIDLACNEPSKSFNKAIGEKAFTPQEAADKYRKLKAENAKLEFMLDEVFVNENYNDLDIAGLEEAAEAAKKGKEANDEQAT